MGEGEGDLSSPSGRPVCVIQRPEAVHAGAGAGEHQLVAEALLPLVPGRGHVGHGQAAVRRGHCSDWEDRAFDLEILLFVGRYQLTECR